MTDFTGIHAKKTRPYGAEDDCPCGSNRPYGQCCGPLIDDGLPARSPEALMRSRFSAYKLRRQPYLRQSWHTSTRPAELTLESSVRWTRLEIIDTAEGETDDEGFVEFIAHCSVNGQAQSLHERSRFLNEDGFWRYVDGETPKTLSKPAKVGRNDPCPCGSGKKFKKCCGP